MIRLGDPENVQHLRHFRLYVTSERRTGEKVLESFCTDGRRAEWNFVYNICVNK